MKCTRDFVNYCQFLNHYTPPPPPHCGSIKMLPSTPEGGSEKQVGGRLRGCFVAVNKAFVLEFRLVPVDVVGKTAFYVFPVQLAERLMVNDFEVLRKRQPLRIEDCLT